MLSELLRDADYMVSGCSYVFEALFFSQFNDLNDPWALQPKKEEKKKLFLFQHIG